MATNKCLAFCLTAGLLLCLANHAFAKEDGDLGRAGNWQKSTQGSPDLTAARKKADAEPTNAEAQNDLGWALRQNNHPQEAEAYLKKAETLNPALAYVHSNLSVVYLDLSKKQQSLEEAALAVAADQKQPIYHVVYGNALLANEKAKEAISQYQTAIQQRPDYENAYYNLARAFKQDGQNTEAKVALSQAYKLDSKDDRVLQLMEALDPGLVSETK